MGGGTLATFYTIIMLSTVQENKCFNLTYRVAKVCAGMVGTLALNREFVPNHFCHPVQMDPKRTVICCVIHST